MGTLSSALFSDVQSTFDAIKSERTNKNHHFPNLITTLVAAIIYLLRSLTSISINAPSLGSDQRIKMTIRGDLWDH